MAEPRAVVSRHWGRHTRVFKMSAWYCIKNRLREAPPSARSSGMATPLSRFMASTKSALSRAMLSNTARHRWARVVPRVTPSSAPRAYMSQ